MSEFKPQFKEGSLVNVQFKGVVTEVFLGKEEKDTFYHVFVSHTGSVRQFISHVLSERSG